MKQLDLIKITDTVYLQFQEKPSDDFALFPIKAEYSFLNGFIPGMFLEKGQTQLMHFKNHAFSFEMKECLFVKNGKANEEQKEEDDEDDFDDEEDAPEKQSFKVSKIVNLVCGMRGLIQE